MADLTLSGAAAGRPSVDCIRVDELAARGYTIEYTGHRYTVYFKGCMAISAGVRVEGPGDPEAMFEKATEACWCGIRAGWK